MNFLSPAVIFNVSGENLICVFQKYNADYDLSAKEGADSLAFISLMEEKLVPGLVRTSFSVQL